MAARYPRWAWISATWTTTGAPTSSSRPCRTRIGAATVATTGWSAGIYDFNNDGRKDLFAANGDLNEARNLNIALAQRAGGAFDAFAIGPPALHRGAAFGDFDNDGRVDA